MPLTSLAPGVGSLDGTSALLDDEGFIFLFNPNGKDLNTTLRLDESIGISNSSVGKYWKISEIYPLNASLSILKHGDTMTVG